MNMCFDNGLCEICRKNGCDKRIEYYRGDMRNVECNGICHICERAIRHHLMIDEQLFVNMKNLHVCIMYHLQKHHNIKFYGRQGENSDQSLIEQAIFQIHKCRICTLKGIIMPVIEKIVLCKDCLDNQEEVCVGNFIAEFREAKICKNLQEVGREIILVISRNNGVNIKEICQHIQMSNSFFIHELTITSMIEDLLHQEKIRRDKCGKYYIEKN